MIRLNHILRKLTELYDLWFHTLSHGDPMFWVRKESQLYDNFLCIFYNTLHYVKSYSHIVWKHADAKQRIAMIVLLDQIPRHIFRHTCEMYAYDSLALAYAKRINYSLTPFEFMYVLMPYQHSESLEDHGLGMKRLQRYRAKHKNKLLERLEKAFKEHTAVIRQFHEYPKRRLDCGYTLKTLPPELREYILHSTHPYI